MSELSIQPTNTYNVPQQTGLQYSENGTPYYESNAGLKTGVLLSIPAVIDFLPDLRLKNADYFEQHINKCQQDAIARNKGIEEKVLNNTNYPEGLKNIFRKVNSTRPISTEAYRDICLRKCKIAIPATIIASGCTIGSGLLIDAVRNKNAKEVAQQASLGNNNPNFSAKNSMIAESGTPYYKSKIGRQLGAILGSGIGILNAYLNGGMAKASKLNIGFRSFLFAVSGLAVGAIYDNVVNKRAEKVANNIQ